MNQISLPIKNSEERYTLKPSKIICMGLNYRKHIEEHNSVHTANQYEKPPSEPVIFPKTPNVLIGPEDKIIYPAILKKNGYPRMDYEGELALIIGKTGKNIAKQDAYEYIFGFTCFNDVTARDLQTMNISAQQPWFKSKSLDTFGPVGPVIVKTEDFENPQKLNIQTRLNGKTVQSANTEDMIYQIEEIVAYISSFFTLEEGDIIITGTPSGIGPMSPGDIVEVEIENIGILRNQVIE